MSKAIEKWRKSKVITNMFIHQLLKICTDPKMIKRYKNTFGCRYRINIETNILTEEDTAKPDWICKNKWCIGCMKLRTATLIKLYSKSLKELSDKEGLAHTVITIPNVKEEDLRKGFTRLVEGFRRIRYQALTDLNIEIQGIRTVETTISLWRYLLGQKNIYHIHLHIISNLLPNTYQVDNEGNLHKSNYIIDTWLSKNEDCNIKGQHTDKIEHNKIIEGFKYLVKFTFKVDGKIILPIGPLDAIFKAFVGSKPFYAFGKLPKLTEEEIEKEMEKNKTANTVQNTFKGIYDWSNKTQNWYTDAYADQDGILLDTLKGLDKNAKVIAIKRPLLDTDLKKGYLDFIHSIEIIHSVEPIKERETP